MTRARPTRDTAKAMRSCVIALLIHAIAQTHCFTSTARGHRRFSRLRGSTNMFYIDIEQAMKEAAVSSPVTAVAAGADENNFDTAVKTFLTAAPPAAFLCYILYIALSPPLDTEGERKRMRDAANADLVSKDDELAAARERESRRDSIGDAISRAFGPADLLRASGRLGVRRQRQDDSKGDSDG